MQILKHSAARIALLYAVVGLCWIFFSDALVLLVAPDISLLAELGTWKGTAFVLISAFFVYLVGRNKEGEIIEASDKPNDSKGHGSLLLTFAVLSLIIVIAGFLGASYTAYNEKKKAVEQLKTVANMKANELKRWINERQNDAEFLRGATFFVDQNIKWQKPLDKELAAKVLPRLEALKRISDYSLVFLVSKNGEILLSTGKGGITITPMLKETISQSLAKNNTVFTDIYRLPENEGGQIVIDFVSPTYSPLESQKIVIVSRVEVERFLYPYMQFWPIKSRTAETLLFRKEGDKILFLNELRHLKNSALSLKIPLKQNTLLAAQAVSEQATPDEALDGVDYRNTPTIGVAQKIDGTNWFLISKQDKSEIYAEARQTAFWIGLADALSIVILAAAILLLHQRRELYVARIRHKEQAEKLEERKAAQEKINRLNRTLEQKVLERTKQLENAYNEMEAFTYSVSHDLRSPLRATDGFSQALLEDYTDKLDEQGKDYLQRIRNASQKMGALIDDLLKLSRLTRHDMVISKVDLGEIAKDVCEELKSAGIGKNATVEIEEGLIAYADANLIKIALTNLISNAFKFSAHREKAHIAFRSRHENGKKIYYIEDDGAGFDMEYAYQLFKPFHRLHTSNEFEGSGIGLAIVQRIIARHFGRVWAQGEVGNGASFFFTLDTKQNEYAKGAKDDF